MGPVDHISLPQDIRGYSAADWHCYQATILHVPTLTTVI